MLVLVIITTIENKRIADPMAWVIKYFRDASLQRTFLFLDSKGIIESKLISSPNHIPIHEYDEMAISVPIIKDVENIILYIFVIKKKRGITFINGV